MNKATQDKIYRTCMTVRRNEMKSVMQKLFKKHGTHLFNLKDRWSEEKEFEDIADYGKEIAKIFKRFGFTDTSVTRAFLIKTNLEGRKLKIKMYQSGRVAVTG